MEGSSVVGGARVRVFVSYAHDTPEHTEAVACLSDLLRATGIEVHRDVPAAVERLDWAIWMTSQLRAADFVIVVASPDYCVAAEEHAEPGKRRGVQWEARLIREEYYADYEQARRKYLPVVLPGGSVDDIPSFMAPLSAMHFSVAELTFDGIEKLYRILTGQPAGTDEPVGLVRRLLAQPLAPAIEPSGSERTADDEPLGSSRLDSGNTALAPAPARSGRRQFLLAAAGTVLATTSGVIAYRIADRGPRFSGHTAAVADKVAARADELRSGHGDLARKLDLAAFQIHPTQKTSANLMGYSYIGKLEGHTGIVESVFFHPRQNLLVSAGADSLVHVWDLDSGAKTTYPGHSGDILAVAFDPSGELLASGGDDQMTIVWNWASRRPVYRLRLHGHTKGVFRLSFSPISNLLATGGRDGRAFLWNPTTGAESSPPLNHSGTGKVPKWVWSLAFHRKKALLATAGDGPDDDSVIRLWNLSRPNRDPNNLWGRFQGWGALAFSPKHPDLLVSADITGRICYTNTAGPNQSSKFYNGDTTQSKCLSFSPNGRTLAIAGQDSIVRIWDASNPTYPARLKGHNGAVNGLAYDRNGEILATAGSDSVIRLWQAAPAAVRQRLCNEGNQLSRDDWRRYIPEVEYFNICTVVAADLAELSKHVVLVLSVCCKRGVLFFQVNIEGSPCRAGKPELSTSPDVAAAVWRVSGFDASL